MPVVLYGCGTWNFTLKNKDSQRMFENWVLRRIFGVKVKDVETAEKIS